MFGGKARGPKGGRTLRPGVKSRRCSMLLSRPSMLSMRRGLAGDLRLQMPDLGTDMPHGALEGGDARFDLDHFRLELVDLALDPVDRNCGYGADAPERYWPGASAMASV